jgi:hypothetical protein
MPNQIVLGSTLRDDLRKRRDTYLLRLTRWERTATTGEGVVQVRRRFAGSSDVPPEAPFETDERRQIEKRYNDDITSYGDWETLRVVRNELNLNRLLAWLVWLKEESARDPSVVKSPRNPFRPQLLPDTPSIFGALPPAEHLPPLERPGGFGGVVLTLRRCGASLIAQSLSAVFQFIAGSQTLKVSREPQSILSDEIEGLMPIERLITEIDGVVKDFEKTQKLRTPSLTETELKANIAKSLKEARPSEEALIASGMTFSSEEMVQEAVQAAWHDSAGELLSNLSVILVTGGDRRVTRLANEGLCGCESAGGRQR